MVKLGMDPKLIEWEVKPAINPSLRLSPHAMQDFLRSASPAEVARMRQQMGGAQ